MENLVKIEVFERERIMWRQYVRKHVGWTKNVTGYRTSDKYAKRDERSRYVEVLSSLCCTEWKT